jgi:hypothetical protein
MYTHTCQTYSRVCRMHTLREKAHFTYGNLVRVKITLVPVEITSY